MGIINMRKWMFIFIAVLGVLPMSGQQETCDCAYPIVFVHGWAGTETSWKDFSKYIEPLYGDTIELPTITKDTGTVYYAHINYNWNTTDIWGPDNGPNSTKDYPNYVDDDVIVHEQFMNAPVLRDSQCVYAISFNVKKDTNNIGKLVASHNSQFSSITEPDGQSPSNQSSAFKQGYALGRAIGKVLEVTGKDKVILVAHSMGGLASREYLQRSIDGGATHEWWVESLQSDGHKVAKLLTVGSPHRGSNVGNTALDYVNIRNILSGNLQKVGLDVRSEAVRDLRYFYNEGSPQNGVQRNSAYLYGNSEGLLVNDPVFYNYDVNCNGTVLESIEGINQVSSQGDLWDGTHDANSMRLPMNLKYTYYVSDQLDLLDNKIFKDNIISVLPQWLEWAIGQAVPFIASDGIVPSDRQWLFINGDGSTESYLNSVSTPVPLFDYNKPDSLTYFLADRVTTMNKVAHLNMEIEKLGISLSINDILDSEVRETYDIEYLLRGIDEADFPFFAYEVSLNTSFTGISQRRADVVAANSNAQLYENSGVNDPSIDSDWYKVSIPAGNTNEYQLIFNKSDKRYYKIDFFSFQTPDPYSNPYSSGLDTISELGKKEQIVLDLGILQEGDYYFRITSDASYHSEDLSTYTFRLYHPQPCVKPEFGMVSQDCDNPSSLFTHNQVIEFNGETGLAYQFDVLPESFRSEQKISNGLPIRLEGLENNRPYQIIATNVLDNSCADTLYVFQNIDCSPGIIECNIPNIFLSKKGKSLKELFCDSDQNCFLFAIQFQGAGNKVNNNSDLPDALNVEIDKLNVVGTYESAKATKDILYYGSLNENENIETIKDLFETHIDQGTTISSSDSIQYITELSSFDIPIDRISLLINRINQTKSAWDQGVLAPSFDFVNILNFAEVDSLHSLINQSMTYAAGEGESNIDGLYNNAIDAIQAYSLEDDPNENAVCASIGIKLSQSLTMTREAFEGTLTIYNGSQDGAMDSIEVELVITDENGVVSNDLFEIETTSTQQLTAIDGTGMLAADTEGTATILFIPEIGAAPTVPKPYSFGGNLSYIDPFSGLRVTLPLVPVTLTVNPSPDLFLHYFMERDVLGDDVFTSEIEPSIPAKLGLMIENNGYGEARNVRIETAQPQVVDNDKGLALGMNFIGSRLQGQPANMGLNNINFGSIDPLTTKVGEWLFTSDLLGHFTGYSTNLRHVDSRGNPNLSLISGVELHELIRSITVYGNQDDGIEDFLVNEVPDANDHPDAIFLTQGNTVYDVAESFTGEFIGDISYPTFTNTFSITPIDTAWNYIEVEDPGQGQYEIVSVTRDSDGFVLPATNAWLTYVTIPDTRQQIYEDKFHLVDDVPALGPQSYTVVWSPKDPNPPEVDTITGHPQQLAVLPVTELQITFSEEIADSTFSWEDISLTRSGGANLIDASLSIVKIDSITYSVDISSWTTENGYYEFIVQAAGVRDLTGVPGQSGKQASWTQSLTGPAIVLYTPISNGDVVNDITSVDLLFNLAIDTSTFSLDDIEFTYQGGLLDETGVSLDIIDPNLKMFRLSNLNVLNQGEGNYGLAVDLPNIASTTSIFGSIGDSIEFTLDNQGPDVTQLIRDYAGGLDAQHVTSIQLILSEEILALDTMSIAFLKDGIPINDLAYQVTVLSDTTIQVSWNSLKTYDEGVYSFSINESMISDLAGNIGSGNISIGWTVNRTSTLALTNLDIDPDYGISADDELTYNDVFNLAFTLNEPSIEVKCYQNDNGLLTLVGQLGALNAGVHSIPVSLVSKGNTELLLAARDTFTNLVEEVLSVNIDEVPLSGSWVEPQGLERTDHPATLHFTFLKNVLDEGIPSGAIEVLLNNNAVTHNLTISRINNVEYEINNIMSLPVNYGEYQIGIDLSKFHKESSGISGSEFNYFTYTIPDPNIAPVADAGPDQIITDLGQITLDASASFDPDSDPISYQWITYDDITLSNDTIANPQFDLDLSHIGQVLTFMLIVEDQTKTSTDLVRIIVALDDIYLQSRIFLQGPFDPVSGLMNDLLRSQDFIPLNSPYADTSVYKFGDPMVALDPTVLQLAGNDAIVDWVYLEINDEMTSLPVKGGAYLLQRDGDIVGLDGGSRVVFEDVDPGTYTLSIYHRNHLPIRTSEIVILQPNELKNIDFSDDLSMVLGELNAMRKVGQKYTMISGDANGNGQIQNSDVVRILPEIGRSGYLLEDTNMNGQVQNNDIQAHTTPNLGKGKQFENE